MITTPISTFVFLLTAGNHKRGVFSVATIRHQRKGGKQKFACVRLIRARWPRPGAESKLRIRRLS